MITYPLGFRRGSNYTLKDVSSPRTHPPVLLLAVESLEVGTGVNGAERRHARLSHSQ